jgi:sugar/nucleoside kinase (ribokinase family)
VRIALLGSICIDVVAGAPPRPGGGVYHAARAFSRLGRDDVIVTAACAPADAPLLGAGLEAFGLPTTMVESSVTTAYSFHYEGERRVMRQEAVADPWTPERAVAAAADAEWVYVGALTRSDFPVETLAALAAGRQLLVDAHGLVRLPTLGPLAVDGDVGDALRDVTILKLNDEEAEILVGGTDEAALRGLGVPEVTLTLGSRGSLVVAGDVVERIAASPVDGDVDPTGAGDVFSAAYLDERSRGTGPAEAARAASRFVARLIAV